jgi:hypothetical protein
MLLFLPCNAVQHGRYFRESCSRHDQGWWLGL